MTSSESQELLDLAKAWETAAELHEKDMRRNRSFATPGQEGYEFYLAESSRDEIKMNAFRSRSRELTNLVNELSPQEAVSTSATK